MSRLYIDNLKAKIKYWIGYRKKSIDFVEGYLQASCSYIDQSEHKELRKYAKTLTK